MKVEGLCEFCEGLLKVGELDPEAPVVADVAKDETTLPCVLVDKLVIMLEEVEVGTIVGLL